MKYFNTCKTIEEVKKTFKELAKALHPDQGGNETEFKEMMQDYNTAFNLYKIIHTNAACATYSATPSEANTIGIPCSCCTSHGFSPFHSFTLLLLLYANRAMTRIYPFNPSSIYFLICSAFRVQAFFRYLFGDILEVPSWTYAAYCTLLPM